MLALFTSWQRTHSMMVQVLILPAPAHSAHNARSQGPQQKLVRSGFSPQDSQVWASRPRWMRYAILASTCGGPARHSARKMDHHKRPPSDTSVDPLWAVSVGTQSPCAPKCLPVW